MRAGRLVTLLLLLERRGRLTAAELAAELEVSERTVLRDVEELSGAGVPVFAVRGPGGGYELLEGTGTALAHPGTWRPMDRRAGRVRRATVRITPDGRRLAAVLGRLQPLRVRRAAAPDAAGRFEATFRIGAFEGAVVDLCSLGPDVEVLAPEDLRLAVAARLHAAAGQYPDGAIEPIRKTRVVALPVAEAFELFTSRMGDWWPLRTHSISGSPDALVRFDGRVGGQVVEIAPNGETWSWADVTAWEPPHRIVLSWHPNPAPEAASILEVRFSPDGDGCRIDLEHRGWDAFGLPAGRGHREAYDPGWDVVLAPLLARAGTPA